MSRVTPQDLLQPYLFDRLTGAIGSEVIDSARLEEIIVRDLIWLLNTKAMFTEKGEKGREKIAESVLNFGVTDMVGVESSNLLPRKIEELVKQAIRRFEPRINPNTLRVRDLTPVDSFGRVEHSLEIHAEVWALPRPVHVRVLTSIDLQTGRFATQREEKLDK